MYAHGIPHPEFLPSQLELSRDAERRFAHSSAARANRARRTRTPRSGPVRRARHALANRLVATARLIDAT